MPQIMESTESIDTESTYSSTDNQVNNVTFNVSDTCNRSNTSTSTTSTSNASTSNPSIVNTSDTSNTKTSTNYGFLDKLVENINSFSSASLLTLKNLIDSPQKCLTFALFNVNSKTGSISFVSFSEIISRWFSI